VAAAFFFFETFDFFAAFAAVFLRVFFAIAGSPNCWQQNRGRAGIVLGISSKLKNESGDQQGLREIEICRAFDREIGKFSTRCIARGTDTATLDCAGHGPGRGVAMFRVVLITALSLTVAACGSPYLTAETGNINRPVNTVWVGYDNFVYVPGSKESENFDFVTAKTGRVIEPGLMYTDGGTIPRFAQIFKGFSPWGFGPAYVIHDWIFYARHCEVDRAVTDPDYNDAVRFRDVDGITFDESAEVLAEVIRTIVDNGQVKPENVPATFISAAVDSVFAAALWNEAGHCEDQRVTPHDIAMVWIRYNDGKNPVPPTWKLSKKEIDAARQELNYARGIVRTVGPVPDRKLPAVASRD
jgi:hypothetical protein